MNIMSVFTGPYALAAKWGVIALLVSAFAGFFWVKGNEHGTQKLIDYQAAQAIATIKLAEARIKIVTQVQTVYRDRIHEVLVKGDTITKEVPIYVTKADDAGCTIPLGFVRNFNAAWANTPAGPAAESDRAASGVPLSTVAEVDSSNASSCLVYKTQRDGLIEFYRKLQDAH